jgi:hypothetical protein
MIVLMAATRSGQALRFPLRAILMIRAAEPDNIREKDTQLAPSAHCYLMGGQHQGHRWGLAYLPPLRPVLQAFLPLGPGLRSSGIL